MIEITSELLDIIYNRVKIYAITKWGSEPDTIKLYGEGDITVEYSHYCCGSTDYESFKISPEDLTQDLDNVARERNEKLEKERKEREIYNKEQDRLRKERELQERKSQYLKLKKEFE